MMSRDKIVYVILCLGLLLYILLRAVYVPLVHDEVATFIHYVNLSEFLPGYSLIDANNHLLNSGLSILSHEALGLSKWSLRVPNILAFLLLAFYAFKLSNECTSSVLAWSFIAAILGSHYMIEFHSLSRGYGMSMAFLLALIFHLKAYLKGQEMKDGLLILLFAFLGVAASLSILFVVLMSFGLMTLSLLEKRLLSKQWMLLTGSLSVIALAIRYSFWLKSSGALYYGSGGGFWENTLSTLGLYLGGSKAVIPFLFLVAFVFGMAVLLSQKLNLKLLLNGKWVYQVLLLGCLIGIFSAHFLLGTNYPEDRVGLYLYPLLIGAFVWSIDYLSHKRQGLKYLALLLFYFPLHFLFNMNLTHVDHWFMERIPASFYIELESAEKRMGQAPTLSGYHTTALTYFLNAEIDGYKVPPMVHQEFPSTVADYIITRVEEKDVELSGYEAILKDEPSGNMLWKKALPCTREPIQVASDSLIHVDEKQFLGLLDFEMDAASTYAVAFDISYDSNAEVVKSHLVLSINRPNGENVRYIPYELDWRQWDGVVHEQGILFGSGSGIGGDELKFYLWNIDKAEIDNLQYNVSLFKLDCQ